MTSEKKPTGWSAIRRRLNAQAKPALLALVKDFYDASSSNRDFLHARVQAEAGDGTAVERYRRTIIEQFYPPRGFGDINEAYYNSLESVLHEMTQLLRKKDPTLYQQFRERIQRLDAHASHIGWGYGDYLRDQVGLLETELAGE